MCKSCCILIIKHYLRVEKAFNYKRFTSIIFFRVSKLILVMASVSYIFQNQDDENIIQNFSTNEKNSNIKFEMARTILGIKIMRTSDRIFKCFDTPCMTKYLSLIKLPLFTTLKSIQPNNFKRMKNFFLCIYVSICQKTCNIFYIMT